MNLCAPEKRPDTEARIAELESRLLLAEEALEALNQALYRQQDTIDRLQAQLRLLHQRFEDLPDEPSNLREDLPPHY